MDPLPTSSPSRPQIHFCRQPAPVASFSQKQNNRRNKRGLSWPAAPVVPQPVGNVAPAPQVLPPSPQNLSQNVEPPPGHKWVLVSDGAQATIPPAPAPEPEPVETSAEMKMAQAAVNRMQYIKESALICLLEPRQRYSLSEIGILEAYVLAHKIEVLAGTTTLASIVISGLEYLKLQGIPCLSQDRLRGRCQFLKSNMDGMLHNFTDVSKLNSQTQDEKLENYNLAIRRTVADFLAHFSRSETFHLRPDVVIQLEAPTTALQSAMSKCGHQIEGYSHTGWRIRETIEKLQDQEYQDVAETALADFEKLKGIVEIRAAILKSTGLHIKDLLGSASHLANASLPI